MALRLVGKADLLSLGRAIRRMPRYHRTRLWSIHLPVVDEEGQRQQVLALVWLYLRKGLEANP